MGKKNLDKLFQEKLSDFSSAPDEKVWQSINASLDNKKKSRKVIPLWWRFGGVAAILIIGLFVINPFENNNSSSNTTTEIETQEDKKNSVDKKASTEEQFENSDTEVVDANKKDVLEEGITLQEDKSNSNDKNPERPEEKNGNFKTPLSKEGVQIANEAHSKNKKKSQNNRNELPSKETGSVTSNNRNDVTAVQNNTETQNPIEKNALNETINEGSDKLNTPSVKEKSGIAYVEEKETSIDEVEATKKKSIFDEIAEQEEEKEIIAENRGGRWSAGPSIAPVYFDAIGEGSPVHSIFVPNSKSGDLNLSYGLSVAYEINDKLKIRSGVHRVDYGYSTDDVEFSSSLESSAIGQIANVNYSATAKNIVVASNASEISSNSMDELVAQDFSGQGLSQNGAMTQQFGYLEVPVELEYSLLDKKFGVNLIGGISSLFLVDNSISLSSGELTTEMGEANNVNDVNFSTNVGIGLNYKFTSKVQLNVEPVFKYQLNTFSQTDGTFQPFTVGVYSGISFKF